MLFVVHYTFDAAHRDAATTRFQETGGPPPEGAKMLGRWHSVGGREGWVLCETDDPVAIGTWTEQWSDLLDFRVVPVVDDQGVLSVLSAAGG